MKAREVPLRHLGEWTTQGGKKGVGRRLFMEVVVGVGNEGMAQRESVGMN